MTVPYPEPSGPEADPAVLLQRLLAYYRSAVVAKVRALDERDRRAPRVPSGWSPLGLVSHLAHMERRWIVWGFHGRQVDGTWGDFESDEREVWWVPDDVTLDDVEAMMAATAAETDELLRGTPLETRASTEGRLRTDPPTLAAICFHVLHEYARHAGHLDVAAELAGGPTGE